MANKINYTGSSKILQRLCAAVNELIDGGSYSLPTASADVKGGIKVGDGLTMDGEVLKNTNPTPATPYTLPIASANTLGGIKVGNNLSIDQNGVLSASGGGGGGGNAMWRVLFCNAPGTETLYREYVANGDDCIYGENDAWSDTPNGNEVQDILKNITQNKSVYAIGPTGNLLPYSDVAKIICEAELSNFDSSKLSWGKGTNPVRLSGAVDVYSQDSDAVYIPTSANGTLAYVDLGSSNKPFTAYIVMKLINPGQYSRVFSAFNARSSGNGIMLYGATINVSSWANDTSTGVSSSADYFVGCIRYNPGASPSAYGKVNNTTGITKSPSTAGQYITIGRTDIDSNTTNAEPANSAVKFVGVVSEAESDSVVQQNIAHLMSTFNIT